MLGRMIFKLSLKALLPLVAVAGMASYAQYMAGGDPLALWSRVGGGMLERLAGGVGDVGDGVRAQAARLDALGEGDDGAIAPTRLWSWRGADGVAHFGDRPPAGVEARLVTVDPNVNVVAPPPARTPPSRAAADEGAGDARRSGTSAGDADTTGAPLPGIAGALGARRGDAASGDAAAAAALRRLLAADGR